jgi:hypothetical protein
MLNIYIYLAIPISILFAADGCRETGEAALGVF